MTADEKYNLLRYFLRWAQTRRLHGRMGATIWDVRTALDEGERFDALIERVRRQLEGLGAERRPEALYRRFVEAHEAIKKEPRP